MDTLRRIFTFSVIMFVAVVSSCATGIMDTVQYAPDAGQNQLQIPQLIDSREEPEIALSIERGTYQFYPGIASQTMGFNGAYLGPTIRLYKNTDVGITMTNNLDESTSIHGHGLHVRGEVDGGPQSLIKPGESRIISFPVSQEAGTSWYHPHFMGKTASQVHAGLAGVYIIEDENSLALDLPKEYGVNDIPLVVQDRSFTDGIMNDYKVDREQLIDGLREDTLVVNGTLNAFHNVPGGWVRLRLLNGSNSRFYRFAFDKDISFYKIATEGGFLNQPVQLESIEMAPGERNEIMIDMSQLDSVSLIADLLPADPEDNLFKRTPKAHVVELLVDPDLAITGELPETLNNISFFNASDATKVRTFSLQMDGNNRKTSYNDMFSINGQSMDMNIINEQVKKGDVEIWRITGERMPHPFHIHGASFQILRQNGKLPAEADRGWKDTVVVWDEVTEIILRFDHEATEEFPYMYHCHMLEHEEAGMMGQFTVSPNSF